MNRNIYETHILYVDGFFHKVHQTVNLEFYEETKDGLIPMTYSKFKKCEEDTRDAMAQLSKTITNHIKPPLGLMPVQIWTEHRLQDINEAIERYMDANEEIPQEWINEKQTLQSELDPHDHTEDI